MLGILKSIFLPSCDHVNIKKIDRKIVEYKCDCCAKVLYLKEETDFIIESDNAKE